MRVKLTTMKNLVRAKINEKLGCFGIPGFEVSFLVYNVSFVTRP